MRRRTDGRLSTDFFSIAPLWRPPRLLDSRRNGKESQFGWQKAPVATLKLQLDALNPRIDVPDSASQEQIRSSLIESEKVVDLARAIVRTNGVMAGERIIVTTENNRFIVLEGNRRVCACQILIKPELAPAEYRDSFQAALRHSKIRFRSSTQTSHLPEMLLSPSLLADIPSLVSSSGPRLRINVGF
jgi:hypothetical protein